MSAQHNRLGWTEEDRLAALHDYGILDTPRETEFDDITQMAAQACGAPISLLNLIDRDRQWFKAEVGLGFRQMPIEPSICTSALVLEDALVVPDTHVDPRLADNPLVLGHPTPASMPEWRYGRRRACRSGCSASWTSSHAS